MHLFCSIFPATLATDDEGILQINITDEFVRAVTHQHLGYPELKQMARASAEYSFLPGASCRWVAKYQTDIMQKSDLCG